MHLLLKILLGLIIYASLSILFAFAGPLQAQDEAGQGELIPLANWQKQFKITDGKDRGKIVPVVLHHDHTREQRWVLVFGDYGAIRMRSDPAGTLMMERLDLFRSRRYIVYEPALRILPRDAGPAESVVRQANFKMYDLETGSLKRSGSVSHLVKRILPSKFDTPAGPIDGYYVDIEHRMDMPYAQLELTVGLGCRLDEGLVYGSGRYRLTKLGIFSQTKTVVAAVTKR